MSFLGKLAHKVKVIYRRVTKQYELEFKAPSTKRTDIYYGYYSTDDAQPLEVKDHTNLHWETQFQGPQQAIVHMQQMDCAAVVDLAPQLFRMWNDGVHHAELLTRAQAEANLQAFFAQMSNSDVLRHVVGFAVHDEPNLHHISEKDLELAVSYVRSASARWPELHGVKLVCIYQATMGWPGIGLFDWVGFDDYKRQSSVLESGYGQYGQFVKHLRPDQRTIILPGGAYGHSPKQFLNFAHANNKVAVVLPFLWHPVDGNEVFAGIGHGKESVRELYVAAGRELSGKS